MAGSAKRCLLDRSRFPGLREIDRQGRHRGLRPRHCLGQIHRARAFLSLQRSRLSAHAARAHSIPALTDLNKAADIDPTNFYAYWNRGALRMAESDFASAQSDFTTALSLNPDAGVEGQDRGSLERRDGGLEGVHGGASREPAVITDPSQFGGELEGSASAASGGLPIDAMPSYPARSRRSPPMAACRRCPHRLHRRFPSRVDASVSGS